MLAPYSLSEGSRYKLADVVTTTPRHELTTRPMLTLPEDTRGLGYYMTVTEHTRIDTLAYRFLGDSRLWWVIADLNPEIEDFYNLPVGVDIFMPTAESVASLV